MENKIKLELTAKNNVNFVAYLLNENNELTKDNFVFYNNTKTDGIELIKNVLDDGNTSLTTFDINFKQINKNIKKIQIMSTTSITTLMVGKNEDGVDIYDTYKIKPEYPYRIVFIAEYIKTPTGWVNTIKKYQLLNYKFDDLVEIYYSGVVLK